MLKKFTREERIANSLMLFANFIDNIGLLNGKTGIAIYFYYLSRKTKNAIFEEYASELIDQVTEALHRDMPLDFENGISGIGWAIEHLIKNGFVDADADDILEEFDMKINNQLIHGDNDLNITMSIAHYYISRLAYRINDFSNLKTLEIKYNVILLIDELERQVNNLDDDPTDELRYILLELRDFNIFNYKVNKMLQIVGEPKHKCKSIIPKLEYLNKKQVLELLNMPDVKSIYAGYDLSNIDGDNRWGLKEGIAGIGLRATTL